MMPQLSHHSTARNSVVDIVDLSGNIMQQTSSTQKEKGGKKKQKQKLRDIDLSHVFHMLESWSRTRRRFLNKLEIWG
jgi:hypothetical protein